MQVQLGLRLAGYGFALSVAAMSVALTSSRADTWREHKGSVEWAFKLGAVSVALEKCPFVRGKRFEELATNARDIPRSGTARTEQEGRDIMLVLDGPEASLLCGTAYKFFGEGGNDLEDVLALKDASKR